jgi:Kdo2-lipid IVA lauroyltransferase/acyltransferase
MSFCQQLARLLARFLWHKVRLRRKVIEENLQRAFPERSAAEHGQIALAMWEHLVVMVAEIAHAPRKIHMTNWREHTSFPQMRTLVRHLLDPRPVVILSGHFGNFEMGGYLMGLHGFPTHTIARPLDNRYLDRFINQFRGATGQYMLPKTGSSRQIALLLEQGATLVLLGDQYGGAKACWVDFFGQPASTNKAVAVFTLLGNAPTATCGVARKGAPLHFEMQLAGLVDPTDEDFQHGSIPDLIKWYTECLEQLIRSAPEQYWWVHRRWKGKPGRRRPSHRNQHKQAA